MKYIVHVTATAAEELDEAYNWLASQTEQHAPTWYNGLLDAVISLEDMPGRFPLATQVDESNPPVRQFLYGDKRHGYLILFEIRHNTVRVLHIRHASRGNQEK